jgi:hypothetical protein
MTATYINRQFDGTYTYFDLVFEENVDPLSQLAGVIQENTEPLLRLGGVIFLSHPSVEEMENRVIEIAGFNLPDYEINQIIT